VGGLLVQARSGGHANVQTTRREGGCQPRRHEGKNKGSNDARRTRQGHIVPKHDYEPLWKHPKVAVRATNPRAAALARRPGTMEVHELFSFLM